MRVFHNPITKVLIVIKRKDVTNLYSISEYYTKNLNFDTDKSEQEYIRYEPVNNKYADSEGRVFKLPRSKKLFYKETVDFFTTQDGVKFEKVQFSDLSPAIEVSIEQDGSTINYLILKSEDPEWPWKEVTSHIGTDFSKRLKVVGSKKRIDGYVNTFIDPITFKTYFIPYKGYSRMMLCMEHKVIDGEGGDL